jgi:hypothetical protein
MAPPSVTTIPSPSNIDVHHQADADLVDFISSRTVPARQPDAAMARIGKTVKFAGYLFGHVRERLRLAGAEMGAL